MKSPQQKGKDFENKVQRALEDRQRTLPVVCLRLYDTRSAGNYLPSQPGDFVLCNDGQSILIEVKSSEKHDSLADRRAPLTSLFDEEQVAKMRLWYRAGAKVLVIFQSQETGIMEIWPGNYIAECYITSRKRAEAYCCDTFRADEFEQMIEECLELHL